MDTVPLSQVELSASPFHEVLSVDTTLVRVTSTLFATLNDRSVSYRWMSGWKNLDRAHESLAIQDGQEVQAAAEPTVEEDSPDALLLKAASTALGTQLNALQIDLVNQYRVPDSVAEDWISQCRQASARILEKTGIAEVSRRFLIPEFDIQVGYLNAGYSLGESEGQLNLTFTARARGSSLHEPAYGKKFSVAVISRR